MSYCCTKDICIVWHKALRRVVFCLLLPQITITMPKKWNHRPNSKISSNIQWRKNRVGRVDKVRGGGRVKGTRVKDSCLARLGTKPDQPRFTITGNGSWLAEASSSKFQAKKIKKIIFPLHWKVGHAWVKLTDWQILSCKLHKNAFGSRAPRGPAGGAIAIPRPPSRYKGKV